MIIPKGNAKLDFIIRAEAELLAREHYNLSLRIHDPQGISTCAETWDELEAGSADDGPDTAEPENYTRSLAIDVQEALLRDLSRKPSMDAAAWRLGALVKLPNLDTYITAPRWHRFNGAHWTLGRGRCVEFNEEHMDTVTDGGEAMAEALRVALEQS